MKNLLLISIFALMLTCCSKNSDDNQLKTELEKLPPATQTGANTAGCLVNGKAFLPKGYVVTGNLVCNYINGKDFVLGIDERIIQGAEDNLRSITVISRNQNLHDNIGLPFPLNRDVANSKAGTYIINAPSPPNPTYYTTTESVVGELKITNHNFNEAIISGIFWFDAINSNGEIVQVRDGRFDMRY